MGPMKSFSSFPWGIAGTYVTLIYSLQTDLQLSQRAFHMQNACDTFPPRELYSKSEPLETEK